MVSLLHAPEIGLANLLFLYVSQLEFAVFCVKAFNNDDCNEVILTGAFVEASVLGFNNA